MEMDITSSIAASAVEPSGHANQQGATDQQVDSSTTAVDAGADMTAEAPKVSMMAKVSANFVIPKNKALVPVTRTTTKWEPLDPKKEELKPLSRKTKWGPDLTEDPVVKRGRALALQTRAEQLAAQLESNNLEIDYNEATRSPSPPPLYDAMGHRMNTREGRKRDQLDVERRDAIGECMSLNPFYKPPSGFRPVPKEAKLFIPVKENPGYNFIGLILGPRGNTQKRLEADTGCKITIRGKGSIKDGKTLPYRHGKDNDGTSEDLHVHIAAETFEKVDAAVAIIEPLLIPVDEDRNIYKMKQLRELAEMNGTVREFMRICTLCGEEGHREWQCPKDKLQTFQAKVICRLCGDGSHPTIDCPLKHSGQGKAIDKEYLSFLEELGVGLGGIDAPAKPNLVHTSSADPSQPMLLTASGAQPMPSAWMGAESDNASNTGGFPRFPFPFPFPPPGSQGMNAMMNLVPRLFHPAFLGLFRGRPVPPPLQMMAFMLSAFRGRFPFPPFGPRPNMMRPPMPSREGTPMDNPTSGQNQTSEVAADGAAVNNFEPAQNYSESLPPSVATFDGDEKQHYSAGVPVMPAAEAPSFPSSSLPPFLAATASPLPRSPPRFETAATFPSTGNLVPAFSSAVSTPDGLPLEVPSSGHAVPPVTPLQAAVPSFRPVPSVRSVIPPVGQSPSFSHLGGPGLAPPITPPPWVGPRNISSLPSLENQSRISETWASSATWSPSQSYTEASSTSQLNKPASDYTSPQFFPKPSTGTQVPPRIDAPYSFNSDESPTLFSTAAGSGPPSFPPLHPPSVVSSQFGYLTPRSMPSISPTITPGVSTTAQGQFGTAIYNQPSDHQSLNYSNSRLGPPPAMASHFRAGEVVTATPPLEDYRPYSSLSERNMFSRQGLPAYSPDAPPSSRLQTAYSHERGSLFSASDFSYARPQASSYAGPHSHLESRNVDVYNAGSVENQELRGTTMLPPSDPLDRSYRYDPSIPVHLLQQRGGSPHEPYNANSWSISRP